MAGKLYVVATPIGNLEDITLRALRILSEVDIIACEDTRMTKRLLNRHEIVTRTVSYHAHSSSSKIEWIIEQLKADLNIALVSDAGTPAISDPGASLVRAVKDYNKLYLENVISIESVPGPSAITTAYSLSGIESTSFTFLGFPPHKKGRRNFFENVINRVVDQDEVVMFYESPHRVDKALNSLSLSDKQLKIVIARELTKIHEDVIEGNPSEIIKYFEDYPEKKRGEFVIIVNK